MEVSPGYKQTEVGVIPEDWEVIQFAQAVREYIDYRGRTPRKLGLSWGGGDILTLSANNVQMGRIDPDRDACFGGDELYRKWMVQGDCELGDVLLTMEAPLGNIDSPVKTPQWGTKGEIAGWPVQYMRSQRCCSQHLA